MADGFSFGRKEVHIAVKQLETALDSPLITVYFVYIHMMLSRESCFWSLWLGGHVVLAFGYRTRSCKRYQMVFL